MNWYKQSQHPATWYAGWKRETEVPIGNVTNKEALDSVKYIPCGDCDGTGLFELTDGTKTKCITCKGSKKIPISV